MMFSSKEDYSSIIYFLFLTFSSMDVTLQVTLVFFLYISVLSTGLLCMDTAVSRSYRNSEDCCCSLPPKTGAKKNPLQYLLDCLNHRLLKSLLLWILWCGRWTMSDTTGIKKMCIKLINTSQKMQLESSTGIWWWVGPQGA